MNNSTKIGSTRIILLYETQQGACFYCNKKLFDGKKVDCTIDHKDSRARGGKKENNMCLCCAECNTLKGSLSEKEFRIALDLMKQGKVSRLKIISYGEYLLAKLRFEVKKF